MQRRKPSKDGKNDSMKVDGRFLCEQELSITMGKARCPEYSGTSLHVDKSDLSEIMHLYQYCQH